MSEKKKVNLAEAMKQKLAEKKQQQTQGKNGTGFGNQKQTMKSQQFKKVSNTRRKMGS
ncbi:hypothetical protein PU629_10770 [Pullulanibacillus sp. KACC 23026]|uniref:hypothetical protein n=1 Tax=Pullulanibacillus sp. KACC 23026 TaxID=3028315 RepID=UPI0023B0AFEA|nr:hypothetical protein [Pullulanibacillus sp. KACC 23026]WEG14793.1 hypothetical protein PU629_10770 [Pullulanibacillus sp. KACC 23026]